MIDSTGMVKRHRNLDPWPTQLMRHDFWEDHHADLGRIIRGELHVLENGMLNNGVAVRITEDEEARIVQLRRLGYSVDVIANEVGRSPTSVKRVLSRLDR